MDSDVTRTYFFPWMVPVYHVASLRRPRTSETVHRRHRRFSKSGEQHVCDLQRFVERLTRFDPKFAPNKALLGTAEIISLDTRSLQRAWALVLTRSKPLKNAMPQNVSQLRSPLGGQSIKHDHSIPCYQKEPSSSSHRVNSASSKKC